MNNSSLYTSRRQRKDQHLAYASNVYPGEADFSEVELVHNCLPETEWSEVQLRTSLAGMSLPSPLFINAITGGTEEALRVNRSLARVARKGGFAMAVGSQKVGLGDPEAASSFEVVRRFNPAGVIWANLGYYADVETARRAIDMIGADGIQIHLNIPQELAMGEGDTSFKGILEGISELCRDLKVPVMVKEVGFGLSQEQSRLLQEAGVKALDVGGRGGTNFLQVENWRHKGNFKLPFQEWGIPTPISLIETLSAVNGKVDVMSSGGIHGSLEIGKSLALGAKTVGIAGMALRILEKYGEKALFLRLKRLERELRTIMLMTGSADLQKFSRSPVVVTGYTAEWLRRRGIDVDVLARQGRFAG